MNQTTPNLGINLYGSSDEPGLVEGYVSAMLALDQAIGTPGEDKDTVARAAAAAAQSDATQALTNAATADGKAVAAQADATQALADAATAAAAAAAASGKAPRVGVITYNTSNSKMYMLENNTASTDLSVSLAGFSGTYSIANIAGHALAFDLNYTQDPDYDYKLLIINLTAKINLQQAGTSLTSATLEWKIDGLGLNDAVIVSPAMGTISPMVNYRFYNEFNDASAAVLGELAVANASFNAGWLPTAGTKKVSLVLSARAARTIASSMTGVRLDLFANSLPVIVKKAKA